jgi:asparagine synthase (glutamine-hydrolysing)
MCGIAAILHPPAQTVDPALLKRMVASLQHRGPDGEQVWVNETEHIGLGHRRLAILDLSAAGSQPMHYLHYTIIHNGEIYNFQELRSTLQQKGYLFSTQTDTEVIAAAYDYWKADCVRQFDGMFAFLIWDHQAAKAFMARDAFGEKPLYYALVDQRLYVGSEMKALWAAGIERKIKPETLLRFLSLNITYNGRQDTDSGYEGIAQLPPAHYATYHPASGLLTLKAYPAWEKQAHTYARWEEAVEHFQALMQVSVQRRLRSDVAIGSSFSGGLDSNTVKWFVENGNDPAPSSFHTFSAVFPGFDRDESDRIQISTQGSRQAAFHIQPDATGLLSQLQHLCQHQELPFDSASVFAQWQVYAEAQQQQVRVLLDGQGADEVLAGYSRYVHWHLQGLLAAGEWKQMRTEKQALQAHQIPFQWGFTNWIAAWLPNTTQQRIQQHSVDRMGKNPYLNKSFIEAYQPKAAVEKPVVQSLEDILQYDLLRGPLQTLLRYADRNAMAHGCETRLPFLQRDLVGFLMGLPAQYKIQSGYTKWILRKMMDKRLPDAICWNPQKIGFEPPQELWMKDPAIQESIRSGKEKLIQAGILRPETRNRAIVPSAAYATENHDWRWWIAAYFVS